MPSTVICWENLAVLHVESNQPLIEWMAVPSDPNSSASVTHPRRDINFAGVSAALADSCDTQCAWNLLFQILKSTPISTLELQQAFTLKNVDVDN